MSYTHPKAGVSICDRRKIEAWFNDLRARPTSRFEPFLRNLYRDFQSGKPLSLKEVWALEKIHGSFKR